MKRSKNTFINSLDYKDFLNKKTLKNINGRSQLINHLLKIML